MQYLDTLSLSKKIHRTPAAIRNLVMRKQIPFRKPGGKRGRLMFIESEIEEWIESAPGTRLEEIIDKEMAE